MQQHYSTVIFVVVVVEVNLRSFQKINKQTCNHDLTNLLIRLHPPVAAANWWF